MIKELCIEVTDRCYLKCIHCSADAKEDLNPGVDFSIWREAIDEFAEIGGKILEISGGEPLTCPYIYKLIKFAKSKKLEVRLYTSGYLLDKENIKKLQEVNVDKFILSIQGPNREVHDKITGVDGSFDKIVENIITLKKAGNWVGIHFVPMKPNFRYLQDTAKLTSKLGIDEFAILRFVPQGRGLINRKKLELNKDEMKNLISEFEKIKKDINFNIRIGRPFNIRYAMLNAVDNVKKCNAGITKCLIKPNGDVAPCPAFKQNKDYVMGNIKYESFKNIWQDLNRWEEFRNQKYINTCFECSEFKFCGGGCPAQRNLHWGNLKTGPDPACVKKYCLEIKSIPMKNMAYRGNVYFNPFST